MRQNTGASLENLDIQEVFRSFFRPGFLQKSPYYAVSRRKAL
jgi:hypothetical protein